MPVIIGWIAVLILVSTSIGIIVSREWCWEIGLLSVQYLGGFFLLLSNWSIALSSSILVTGWMASAVLAMTYLNLIHSSQELPEIPRPTHRFFQVVVSLMVWAACVALSFRATSWLGVDFPVALGGLGLIGSGLTSLGIISSPARISSGLLTFLLGFKILYASVENAALVVALLVAITLGIALVGGWILTTMAGREAS